MTTDPPAGARAPRPAASARPARRRPPALASRIAVTGLSAAATLGMVGGWALAGSPVDQPAGVRAEPEGAPRTIVVRVVRRQAATPAPRRIVRRVVRSASAHAAGAASRANTRTKAS